MEKLWIASAAHFDMHVAQIDTHFNEERNEKMGGASHLPVQGCSLIADAMAAIFVHELAHIASALALKVEVKQVGLSWKGPYIRRDPGTLLQNLFITLAGPGINLLLAAATVHTNPVFAEYNLVLGLFNLLPIPSSDGKRALGLMRTLMTPAPALVPASAVILTQIKGKSEKVTPITTQAHADDTRGDLAA